LGNHWIMHIHVICNVVNITIIINNCPRNQNPCQSSKFKTNRKQLKIKYENVMKYYKTHLVFEKHRNVIFAQSVDRGVAIDSIVRETKEE